jgi:hypothetical protein
MIALVLAPLIAIVPPPPAPNCGPAPTTPVVQHALPPARATRLGDLPDAEMDLAVLRSVDGCAVREVVRFNVSQRGPNGALQAPAQPTPGYAGRLVRSGPAAQTVQTGR